MITAYERTSRDGHALNYRTLEMLMIAERRWAVWAGLTGGEFVLSQGSWSLAKASAGTHAGGGALDVSNSSWDTAGQRDRIVLELRLIGFAAWYRPKLVRADGTLVWDPHIHAIAIGDRELSIAAAAQVADYYAGLNGLAYDGPDTGPRVEIIEYPQQLQELGMEAKDVWAHKLVVPGTDQEVTAGGMLRTAYGDGKKALAKLGALEAIVAKLSDSLTTVGAAFPLTLEELTDAAREGAADALKAGIDIHVDVNDQEPPAPPPPA